jgi:hypothetical protein
MSWRELSAVRQNCRTMSAVPTAIRHSTRSCMTQWAVQCPNSEGSVRPPKLSSLPHVLSQVADDDQISDIKSGPACSLSREPVLLYGDLAMPLTSDMPVMSCSGLRFAITRRKRHSPPVCLENLDSDVMVMKSAENGARGHSAKMLDRAS